MRSRVEVHAEEKAKAERENAERMRPFREEAMKGINDILFEFDEMNEKIKNNLDEAMKRAKASGNYAGEDHSRETGFSNIGPNPKDRKEAKAKVHKVKDGDTVDGIAAKYGVSRGDILESNPNLKDKTSVDKQGRTIILIKEGDKLILPQGTNKQTGIKGGGSSNVIPNN
ncbi:LysM peptidoglycan-binding domain-containing protein [Holosporaceae bacterium 'Namur']|nr:LysM peptidoglycan-binding domain-containing protein [Holosporaceae bacterium 'Namur']